MGYSCSTLWVKNSLKITLFLTVFKIFTLFHFPLKSKMATKSGKNSNFSPRHRILLYYPGQKFARNRSISYGFQDIFNVFFSAKIFPLWFSRYSLFHFPLKSKMAAKSGENYNFFPLNRILLYYPVGQKFARNRSLSYGFRDIHTFSFSAKIQDGRQKWRKLKFFP